MKITDKLESGRINLVHRIVFPPMATESSADGLPTAKTIEHYRRIAENPYVGLIITEHSYISLQGKASPHQTSFASDEVIDRQKILTERVHQTNRDVKIFAQINHAGMNTNSTITGQELVAPYILMTGRGDETHMLSEDEIHAIENQFADAALRVRRSGYDGVEIHAAHGYLLNEFYSPITNLRNDGYGFNSIENRMRIITETIRYVRSAVGDDFPIAVRFGGCDYSRFGSTVDDAVNGARLIEKAGADLIDLSGGMCGPQRRDNRHPGYFSDMSEAVKKNVSVPVVLTGGITDIGQAETFLNEGKADLIGVGRALYRNPKWGM